MASKLGVLVVHGMGSQKADFADPVIEELDERVSDLGAESSLGDWRDLLGKNTGPKVTPTHPRALPRHGDYGSEKGGRRPPRRAQTCRLASIAPARLIEDTVL